MSHQFGYNFQPNDRVWFYDVADSSFAEGTTYQVDIKIFSKTDLSVDSKLSYLVLLDDETSPAKLTESQLYISTLGGLIPPPSTPIYNVAYTFYPGDTVWVINRAATSIKYGTVYQTDIKIFLDADLTSDIDTLYYISYSDSSGTTKAPESDVFTSSDDAWAALGITIAPTPTPTPTGTGTPGISNTITVSKMNSDAISLLKGMPVYIKTDGTVSRSNSDATALAFLGFVYDTLIPVNGTGLIIVDGLLTASSGQWNAVTGGSGIVGANTYYLSALGTISLTAPVSGYSREVGLALNSTDLQIRIMPTIEL